MRARDFRRMGIEVIFLNEVGNGFEIPSYWGSIFDCRNIYFSGSDRMIALRSAQSLSTLLLISKARILQEYWQNVTLLNSH